MLKRSPLRFPALAAGMLSLLVGLWTGLERLGWPLPEPRAAFSVVHGPLMISGFLGMLIAVERAVAFGNTWAFVAPAFTALGALALILGLPGTAPALLMLAGSLGLAAVLIMVLREERQPGAAIMALGALAWVAGNLLWLSGFLVAQVVSWWIGFLVLTIAGERLELSRVLHLSRGRRLAFGGTIALLLLGLSSGGLFSAVGARLTGLAWLGLALWLAANDAARRTVRQGGLARFSAVCLLSGYVWLGVAGLLAIRCGAVVAGPLYDAVLHAVFVGFVFAMIFGHAPIIFPAVLGVPIPFRAAFYAHLVLLHASLALRLVGDLLALTEIRAWGGALNAASIVLFLLNTARAALRADLGRRVAAERMLAAPRAPGGSA